MLPAISGCREGGQIPRPATGEPVIVWRTVGTWTGRASLQTESFISETGLFRVRWESQPPSGSASSRLKIVLHSAVSGRSLITVLEHQGTGKGEASVNEDPREFFLVIDAAETAWTVTLEEGLRAFKRN